MVDNTIKSEASEADANNLAEKIKPVRSDVIVIEVSARESKEYKFYLEQGGTLEYEWSTDGSDLFFYFHREPAGDKSGYFKSFKKKTSIQSEGILTTTFAGTHG